MSEYNLASGIYEYGYQIGHRALFSLRPGESLERDAGNRGLHVNMDRAGLIYWSALRAQSSDQPGVWV